MINYTDIENNIHIIDEKYNDLLTTTHEQILYSKLAIIEFCGWIEESFDQIMNDYAYRSLTNPYQQYVNSNIIKKNYGFEYEKNTRTMFGHILGIKNLETFEYLLDDPIGRIEQFKSLLHDYTEKRNKAAHNSTPHGTTLQYYAPSTVLGDFHKIKLIFIDIDLIVNSI